MAAAGAAPLRRDAVDRVARAKRAVSSQSNLVVGTEFRQLMLLVERVNLNLQHCWLDGSIGDDLDDLLLVEVTQPDGLRQSHID